MNNTASLSRPTITKSPIQALPTELLARILALVCGTQPCALGREHGHPPYPVSLTYVCSRWRSLIINSPILWLHIDFSVYPNKLGDSHDITRACLHLDRANQTPLNVHVLEGYVIHEGINTSLAFIRVLDLCLPRMGSLVYHETHCYEAKILYRCLKSAVPGKLKELTILLEPGRVLRYLDESKFANYHLSEAPNASPETHLDDLLLSITTLRLCDFFPAWASRAYHGLVELCLHIRRDNFYQVVFISHLQLLNILSSSPKLRILDLNLQVTNSSYSSADITPVYLEDLEVVRIGSLARSDSSYLLGLFSPGSNPLSLSLGRFTNAHAYDKSIIHDTVITAFFARSNIKNMWLSGTSYPATLEFLSLAPHSRELALGGVDFRHPPDAFDCSKFNHVLHTGRIDTLYLLPFCKIDLGNLRYMAQAHRVQRILVHEQCKLTLDGSQVPIPSGLALQDALQGFCPSVQRFSSTEPHAWGFPTLYNMGYDI